MCGIFGVISTNDPASRRRAAMVFDLLGILAQQRGTDASGVARFYGRPNPTPSTELTPAERLCHSLRVDGWQVSRRPVRWKSFWKLPQLQKSEQARILMGHTRKATRGESRNVANLSPMLVSDLLGTHNGGVAIKPLVENYGLDDLSGNTSSEAIFAALSTCRGDVDAIVEVLTSLRGRATLAWVDRNSPRRVYLARTALSPLATAWDALGNFYWASSRQWFTTIEEVSDYQFSFRDIQQWREGTLKVYESKNAGAELQETRYFQPFVRECDLRIAERFLWHHRDAAWERANMRAWLKTRYGTVVKLNSTEPDYHSDRDYWWEEPDNPYDYWQDEEEREYEQIQLGF